jgi:hypothetical protein
MNFFSPELHKRASRWDANAEGRAIVVTPRDLDFLFALFIHGPLSTAMLRALVAPHVGQKTVTERLKKLKRRPNAFIEQPWQQRASANANYNHLVVAITDAGVEALIENERITHQHADWRAGINENRNAYEHEAMAAHIMASLDLGCRQDPNLRFVSWLDIFTHDKFPAATKAARNPLLIPFTLDKVDHALIPDGLCGIEHRERGVSFYAMEADRNNEPIEASKFARSSYARHLLGYRFVLRNELYKTHYGIPNMQVLNITVSETHMRNIMAHLKRTTAEGARHLSGAHPFLFKAVPALGRRINKPQVSPHVLTEPFKRVGEERVRIDGQ